MRISLYMKQSLPRQAYLLFSNFYSKSITYHTFFLNFSQARGGHCGGWGQHGAGEVGQKGEEQAGQRLETSKLEDFLQFGMDCNQRICSVL